MATKFHTLATMEQARILYEMSLEGAGIDEIANLTGLSYGVISMRLQMWDIGYGICSFMMWVRLSQPVEWGSVAVH